MAKKDHTISVEDDKWKEMIDVSYEMYTKKDVSAYLSELHDQNMERRRISKEISKEINSTKPPIVQNSESINAEFEDN